MQGGEGERWSVGKNRRDKVRWCSVVVARLNWVRSGVRVRYDEDKMMVVWREAKKGSFWRDARCI